MKKLIELKKQLEHLRNKKHQLIVEQRYEMAVKVKDKEKQCMIKIEEEQCELDKFMQLRGITLNDNRQVLIEKISKKVSTV